MIRLAVDVAAIEDDSAFRGKEHILALPRLGEPGTKVLNERTTGRLNKTDHFPRISSESPYTAAVSQLVQPLAYKSSRNCSRLSDQCVHKSS